MTRNNLIRPAIRTLTAALFTAVTLALPSQVQGQNTIGDDLIARGSYDTFTGFILVSPYSFGPTALGSELSSVSIFNGIVGYRFTPLLVNALGGNTFQVASIGTERTVAASGLQTYAFNAASGSAVIGATSRVAWMTPSGQSGVIPFDLAGTDAYEYTNSGSAITTVGETFSIVGTTNREYSIQFTAGRANPVPEPGTLALLATGLLAVGGIARRRRLS